MVATTTTTTVTNGTFECKFAFKNPLFFPAAKKLQEIDWVFIKQRVISTQLFHNNNAVSIMMMTIKIINKSSE